MHSWRGAYLTGLSDTSFLHSSGKKLREGFLRDGSSRLPCAWWQTGNKKYETSSRKNTGQSSPPSLDLMRCFSNKTEKSSQNLESKQKKRRKQSSRTWRGLPIL